MLIFLPCGSLSKTMMDKIIKYVHHDSSFSLGPQEDDLAIPVYSTHASHNEILYTGQKRGIILSDDITELTKHTYHIYITPVYIVNFGQFGMPRDAVDRFLKWCIWPPKILTVTPHTIPRPTIIKVTDKYHYQYHREAQLLSIYDLSSRFDIITPCIIFTPYHETLYFALQKLRMAAVPLCIVDKNNRTSEHLHDTEIVLTTDLSSIIDLTHYKTLSILDLDCDDKNLSMFSTDTILIKECIMDEEVDKELGKELEKKSMTVTTVMNRVNKCISDHEALIAKFENIYELCPQSFEVSC